MPNTANDLLQTNHNLNKVLKSDIAERFYSKVKALLIYLYQFVFLFSPVKIVFGNKRFMLTPCKHLFHSRCLESWMYQKKECPTCRRDLKTIEL